MQFKQSSDTPAINSRRPSADSHILVTSSSNKEKNVIYLKPNTIRKTVHNSRLPSRPSSPTSIPPIPPIPKHLQQEKQQQDDSDEDEEEEEYMSTAIHVAVRRDASLFRIEKLPNNSNPKESLNSSPVTIASTPSISSIYPSSKSPASVPPLPPPSTIPIVQKSSAMSSKQSLQATEKKRVSFSDDNNKKKKREMGLLTPPDSPYSQNRFDTTTKIIQPDSFLDLNANTPQLIHVQKVIIIKKRVCILSNSQLTFDTYEL